MLKSLLRTQCLDARLRLSPEAARAASEIVCTHIMTMASRRETIVAGYCAVRGEMEIAPALHRLAERGHLLALPVVESKNAPLAFYRWAPGEALIAGMYGIEIPASGARVAPDLVLVPLLAFDGACRRLGYGAGYYDRTLDSWRKTGHRFRAVGIAYAAQRVASLPQEPHDLPLDAVITEEGIVTP